MSATIIYFAAIGLYLASGIYLFVRITRQQTLNTHYLLYLIAAAIFAHGTGLYLLMRQTYGIDLSVQNMSLLVILAINILVLLSSIKKPLHNLFILLLPFSICALVLSLIVQQSHQHVLRFEVAVNHIVEV